MLRKWIAASITLMMLFALVTPVFAIVYGEPDGNDHPFVGSMVFYIPERGYFQWCTGTLISETVFLTASHCTFDVDVYLERYPGSQMLVTFDPVISETSTYYTGTIYSNPAYNDLAGEHDAADTGDIAVIVLDEAPGIEPASLPTLGLLDTLKDDKVLKDTLFTAVGYGTVRETRRTGPQGVLDNMERRRAVQEPLSLTDAWLTLSMNQATGNGGTCYGDSGGPHFIHIDGVETDIVASITVTGDTVCKASDKTYRVDTADSLAFLAQFVTLP